jgi:acetyl-CoA carboxylase carboxyl transferase subunit alpha
MKITAQDLLRFKVIDAIIPEPMGGAHRDPNAAISAVADRVEKALEDFRGMTPEQIRKDRADRFLKIGRNLG